jgi:hypothetical protein
MADELKFTTNPKRDRDALDESLVGLVRDAYSPPGGDDYWAGLEQRIMARVSSGEVAEAGWYSVLAPWARPALIAATAIFALAGIVNYELVNSDSQVAYDSVIESATAGVATTSEELISIERGTEGAALSYYLSH